MGRFTFLFVAMLAACVGFISTSARAADAGFSFADKAGESLDILLDGKIVGRYMYAHDTSTPAAKNATNKPYLHVFDADGKAPITKGLGGEYPHHRGIFIGYTKLTVGGGPKPLNFWVMDGGAIVHQKFSEQKASPDAATFTSVTHWEAEAGRPFLVEERTMTFRKPAGVGRLIVDFSTKLTAQGTDLKLDGDPEHAGVQYRPVDEISRTGTTYLYPVEKAEPHKDKDYPWCGETVTLNDKKLSTVIINHPGNPTGARWSAYRNYGRFGSFAPFELKSGESRTLNYRFIAIDGGLPGADAIQKEADRYTLAKEPTPTPKTTMKPAEGSTPTTKPAKPAANPKGTTPDKSAGK